MFFSTSVRTRTSFFFLSLPISAALSLCCKPLTLPSTPTLTAVVVVVVDLWYNRGVIIVCLSDFRSKEYYRKGIIVLSAVLRLHRLVSQVARTIFRCLSLRLVFRLLAFEFVLTILYFAITTLNLFVRREHCPHRRLFCRLLDFCSISTR